MKKLTKIVRYLPGKGIKRFQENFLVGSFKKSKLFANFNAFFALNLNLPLLPPLRLYTKQQIKLINQQKYFKITPK